MNDVDELEGNEAVAIIGMSCRFPGAGSIETFWNNLQDGKESVSFFTEEEMLAAGVDPELIKEPSYVNAACIIDDIDRFDSEFFGYSTEEAELIDPQQRLFMECAYECFEDAGYVPEQCGEDVGVFGGMRTSGYARVLGPVIRRIGTIKSFDAVLGTSVDQTCLRLSYTLNLKGPSIGVQTACSTSIVAAHAACESLRNGECNMALIGASAINVPQKQGYIYEEGMIASIDGHCRAFDANAKGGVGGNGVGAVLLKRLSDALEDRDHVYAVIKGSAVNNDGSAKIGYRAPSLEGQARVIEEALLMADTPAETISYVEANGTGTFWGDSMEIEALTRVFRMQTEKREFCCIGSVKTNIGHLSQAAGVACLIKTALSLKNKRLVPSLNCETPNPALENSPFYIATENTGWRVDGFPRRAGINSFPMGGTNAHMVLEEAPEPVHPKAKPSCHILTLSARSPGALMVLKARYGAFLEKNMTCDIPDICFTANVGRTHYPFRYYAVASSVEELREKVLCEEFSGQGDTPESPDKAPPKTGFLFGGDASGAFGLYKVLYGMSLGFKNAVDQCAKTLNAGRALFAPDSAHASVFAVEYAWAQMWRSWGVEVSAVMGWKTGTIAAGCVAGIIDAHEGMRLAVALDGGKGSLKENEAAFARAQREENDMESPSGKTEMVCPLTGMPVTSTDFWDHLHWSLGQEPVGGELDGNGFKKQGVHHLICVGADRRLAGGRRMFENETYDFHMVDGKGDAMRQVLECLGSLYVAGADIDWRVVMEGGRFSRISLPTYPFERKLCWFKAS